MNNGQWFDYLTNVFDEEHNLIRIILIGEDNAVRVLAREDYEWEKKQQLKKQKEY